LDYLVWLKILANLIFVLWFGFDFSKSDKPNKPNSPKIINNFILLDINKDYIKDNLNIFIFYKFYLVIFYFLNYLFLLSIFITFEFFSSLNNIISI
jgi:hypothetical protein